MGLSASLGGGVSSGGSSNQSSSFSQGNSYSETDAATARAWSAQQAQIAREWQEKMFEKEMEYNAREAEKARNFNAAEALKNREFQQAQVDVANEMANTVYTRSAKNMREAGINPILAYSAGLGGAGAGSVSGGSSATVGSASTSAPSGFMGQSFMDQHSASASYSKGQSSGSSWEQSQSGLATALEQMGSLISQTLDTFKTGKDIKVVLDGLANNPKDLANDIWNRITSQMPSTMRKFLGIEENNTGVQRKKNVTGTAKVQGHK